MRIPDAIAITVLAILSAEARSDNDPPRGRAKAAAYAGSSGHKRHGIANAIGRASEKLDMVAIATRQGRARARGQRHHPVQLQGRPAPLLKPGDLICDWLKVEDAESRGLLRLFANLTLYAKIAVAFAFLVS